MEDSQKMQLSPGWVTFYKKVKAMFKQDPQVHVGELGEVEVGKYSMMILVDDKDKAEAIKAILESEVVIGGFTITITILGPDEDDVDAFQKSGLDIYRTAFTGNALFEKVITITYPTGMVKDYCVFKKEVIQFSNDDLTDYRGNYNGLVADVAKDIFKAGSVNFCTSAE